MCRHLSSSFLPYLLKLAILATQTIAYERQKCLFPAENAFVASDKHVRLQCDSYLEESSRDNLVISDERVHLQCEIIFGGG